MAKGGRVIRWIAISVILQVALLSYVNFVYLPNRGNITASVFNFAEDSIKSKSVTLPDGAGKITVSFNGLFAAYEIGGKLELYDIKEKKAVKTLDAGSGELNFFRWLPDRDILIYSVKEPGGKKGQVQLLTYDLSSGVERNYPKLTGLNAGSEVVDIELSPLTNIVYFMVKTGDTKTKIYQYNIMDKLKFIMNANVKTTIKESSFEDKLIYGDTSGRIHIRNGKTGVDQKLSFDGKMALLAVDSEDNIIAGALSDDGSVNSIYIGKEATEEKDWKKITLDQPAQPLDIMIPSGGKVYLANRETGKLTEAGGGTALTCKGEIIEMLDDYAVSLEGRKLNLLAAVQADK